MDKNSLVGEVFGPKGQLTVLSYSEVQNVRGHHVYLVRCNICAEDPEFYGDATYCITRNNLLRGKLPCGCNKLQRFSKEQWRIRLSRAANDAELEYEGLAENWRGGSTNIKLRCKKCGHCYSTGTVNGLISGRRCPKCVAGCTFNPDIPANLYVIRVVGESTSFTGFGITNYIEKRLVRHKQNLSRAGFTIAEMFTVDVSGKVAKVVEQKIIENFEILPQNVEGFIREATNSSAYADVVRFVESEVDEITD